MEIPEMLNCPNPNCDSHPFLGQWRDTEKPNATWIVCDCGVMTIAFYDKDPVKAKIKAIKVWNSRHKKKRTFVNRTKKDRILSCGHCDGRKIRKAKYEYTNFDTGQEELGHWFECEKCGIMTEAIIYKDTEDEFKTELEEEIMSYSEAVKLWNWER